MMRQHDIRNRWFLLLAGCFLAVLAALGTIPGTPLLAAGDSSNPFASGAPIRLGISDQVVYGVNRSDAAAAVGVWAQEMATSIGVKLAPQQTWLLPTEQITQAIQKGSLDLACVTTPEYRRIAQYLDATSILTDGGAELLLLVREGGGITGLAGLQGRHLMVLDNPYTILADAWLSVSFAKEGLGAPSKVLGRISRSARPAQVVLPVFFGQADACIAPRRTVETMFELNPQLARKLKVLYTSPKLVSAFLACRKDYPSHLKGPLMQRLSEAKHSPSAKQVQTLFQSMSFTVVAGEVLRPATTLLDAFERDAASGGPRPAGRK